MKRKIITEFLVDVLKSFEGEFDHQKAIDIYFKRVKSKGILSKLASLRSSMGAAEEYAEKNNVKFVKKKPLQIPSIVMALFGNESNFQRMSTQIGDKVYLGTGYYDIAYRKKYRGSDISQFGKSYDVIATSKIVHELGHHVISTNFSDKKALSQVLHGGLYALDIVFDKLGKRFVRKAIQKAFPGQDVNKLILKLQKTFETFRVFVEALCYANELLFLKEIVHNTAKSTPVEEYNFMFGVIEKRSESIATSISDSYMLKLFSQKEIETVLDRAIEELDED